MLLAISLTLIGTILDSFLLASWFQGGLRLNQISYPALLGLLLIILGFQSFVFTLLFQMINTRHEQAEA
jgi:hypothetical protein